MCTYPVTESSPGGRQASVWELSWKERVLSGPQLFCSHQWFWDVRQSWQPGAGTSECSFLGNGLPINGIFLPAPTQLLILIEGFDLSLVCWCAFLADHHATQLWTTKLYIYTLLPFFFFFFKSKVWLKQPLWSVPGDEIAIKIGSPSLFVRYPEIKAPWCLNI